MGSLTIGSLFAGVGGLELGLEWAGLGPVLWQVEQNAFCRSVLAKHWPEAKRYTDVRDCEAREETLLGTSYRSEGHKLAYVDVICGGFPCQDISVAGAGAGLEGLRSGLWFDYLRIVSAVRPRFVAIENVSALVNRGLETVLEGLTEIGYDALWFPLRASDLGAPHKRERLFVVAWRVSDADREQVRLEQQRRPRRRTQRVRDEGNPEPGHVGEDVANSNGERCEGLAPSRVHAHGSQRDDLTRRGDRAWPPGPGDAASWEEWIKRGGPEPSVRRGSHGLSAAMDQLAALGNAVVPQCAEVVGHVIREIAERKHGEK